jgi:ribonuclease P/MRP protein subunit POP1
VCADADPVRIVCAPFSFPPSLAKSNQSHGKAAAVHPHWAHAAESSFWDANVRKKLVAPKYSKVQLDERRAKVRCDAIRLPAAWCCTNGVAERAA